MRKALVRQPLRQRGRIVGGQPCDVERADPLTAEHVDARAARRPRGLRASRRARGQPAERRPPHVAVLHARSGEPAELLEHLGLAERDLGCRRHRHHPRRRVRTAVDVQRHQNVLGRAIPGDQCALIRDGRPGLVGDVGAAATCPRRRGDARHQAANQHHDCSEDESSHAWHRPNVPGERVSGAKSGQAPALD